jgi:hypothetical protein
MIVMKNYMHYCRNTTILEKHISLNISMDRPANSFLDIKKVGLPFSHKNFPCSLLAMAQVFIPYWPLLSILWVNSVKSMEKRQICPWL